MRCFVTFICSVETGAVSFGNPVPGHWVPNGLWLATNVHLSVNVKGCGYPPWVDCGSFHRKFATAGVLLPCYPNQNGNVTMALTHHEPTYAGMIILSFFVVPTSIFGTSLLLLCLVHYPYCCPTCKRHCTERHSSNSVRYRYSPSPMTMRGLRVTDRLSTWQSREHIP